MINNGEKGRDIMDDGSREVQLGMECFNHKDYPGAFQYFTISAQKGNAVGMNNLSVCYANGYGTAVHRDFAFGWMRKAAEAGYAESYYTLAAKYYNGAGTIKSLEQAEYWARKAVDAGTADGQKARQLLGMIEDARKQTAADRGVKNNPGREEMVQGLNYYKQKNYAEAFKWFMAAANKGNIYAMNNVSLCYINGQGVEKDAIQSFEWMKKACEGGAVNSYYSLANKYFRGIGVQKSLEQAEYWAQKAVENKSQHAQNANALLEMISKAKKAPASEDIAEFNEGCRLYNQKQYGEAFKYLEKAARRGHAGALRVIGQAYLYGCGVEKNISNAYKFLRAAAYRGDVPAVKMIAKYLINNDEFFMWKLYAQNQKIEGCEQVFTDAMIQERSREDGLAHPWDQVEAMTRAAECWKNRMRNPNHKEQLSGTASVTSGFAASVYFGKAMRYGNLDAACGLAMYYNGLSSADYKNLTINYYKIAAYLGHSFAMYRVAQYYDTIDRKAADACYRQAALWKYRPALQVCEERGISLN